MQITAVIPCYNEEKHIAEVITKAQKHVNRVLVVDNMSTDRTAEIACEVNHGWDFQKCFVKGAGATTALGIAFSLNPLKHLFADIIVTLDSDGQHDPDEIPLLVQPIIEDKADLVIGSRFMGDYEIRKYRKFGIDVITALYNKGSKQKITDGQSCFRAFNRDVAENIKITEHGFGFSTEFIIKARARGYRIMEVPITCIYHKDHTENSTLNPVRHGLGVAFKTLKWRIKEELLK